MVLFAAQPEINASLRTVMTAAVRPARQGIDQLYSKVTFDFIE